MEQVLTEQAPGAPSRKAPPVIILLPVVLAVVIVPFLFWRGTWFGQKLSDEEIQARLAAVASTVQAVRSAANVDDKERRQRIRKAQHALVEISKRIEAGKDLAVFRPAILELTRHEEPVLRRTVVWLMGWDRRNPRFELALRRMLDDPDPLVRYNAALQVSAVEGGGMEAARRVLHAALRPLEVRVETTGRVREVVSLDDEVREGMDLARIETPGGRVVPVRAPFLGRVSGIRAKAGARLAKGDVLCLLAPSADQVLEVFKAIQFFGDRRDLGALRPFTRGGTGYGTKVLEEARRILELLKTR